MSGTIVVCPLSRLSETLARTGAGTVVTVLAADQRSGMPALPGVAHVALDLSDIVAPRDGFALPAEAHVAELLAVARAWDRRTPLLVHCYAGVSRSPAAAYVMACALAPQADEAVLAADLRRASPNATPNSRLVALGDQALGRGGRMVEAIEHIGRGRECFEGDVFGLEVAFGATRSIDAARRAAGGR